MADAFDQLLLAGFDQIYFPVRKVTVKGGIRQHDHEFPKAPGAAVEKLGRRLYLISMDAVFYNNLLPPWNEDLWPGNLSDLRDRFEQQVTSDLVIPTIGSIKAFCVNWTQEMEARARSGELVQLEFKEDQSSDFLIEGLINVKAQSLLTQAQAILAEADKVGIRSIFDDLVAKLTTITNIIAGAQLLGDILQARVAQVLVAFERLDAAVGAFDNPYNSTLLEVFLDTWSQTLQLHEDILKQSVPLIYYTVPRLMSVSDVSRAIYGDNSRATDILSMNPIEDAFSIRSGTQIRAYAPS